MTVGHKWEEWVGDEENSKASEVGRTVAVGTHLCVGDEWGVIGPWQTEDHIHVHPKGREMLPCGNKGSRPTSLLIFHGKLEI